MPSQNNSKKIFDMKTREVKAVIDLDPIPNEILLKLHDALAVYYGVKTSWDIVEESIDEQFKTR